MATKEKMIIRYLKSNDNNGKLIKADEMLREKYDRVFGEGCGNESIKRVAVIDIQTAYNDYKKLHDDLYELSKEWDCQKICLSDTTDILEIAKMKYIRKACKKKRILCKPPLLSVSEVFAAFLIFLDIVNIICSLFLGEKYPFSTGIVLVLLFACLLGALVVVIQQTYIYDHELLVKLNEMDEDSLIDIFSCMNQRKSRLREKGIFFIENFNKLNRLCRSYVIAYLCHKEDQRQIWCVFDYIFEDSLKIDSVGEIVFYESYKLVPLTYEEKEALYKEYSLQRDIAQEYLYCVGVDILCESTADITNGNFKFHSLDYIKQKIENVEKELDADGRLTRGFYCLVYMSSKYKYSFSMEQMISLIQNKENVNKELHVVICDAGNRIFGHELISEEEIRRFILKITDLLKEYCFINYKGKKGRKVKKYKFSYDILECFQEKMSSAYPDEESVKRWILVKLISNKEMFRVDRYFFDCSNLLVMSDFIEDNEFCILSSYLLSIMNANNCWVYNCPILRRLREIEHGIREQSLRLGVVKRAAANSMFYISNNESIYYGIYFLAGADGCNIKLKDFSLDNDMTWLPEMEKYSHVLAGYFKLMYKVFGKTILSSFEVGQIYQDIDVEPFAEQEKMPEIIRRLLMCCISFLNEYPLPKSINENFDWIVCQLPQMKGCVEANEFASIIKEIILWVKSELAGKQESTYRNINTGMLVEMSNSNMMSFIYELLHMALIKDEETPCQNKNPLFDFISQSIFYFKVVTQAEGITRYVDSLLQSQHSIDLKLNIAISLLVRNNPCKAILCKFIIENMDSAEKLFLSRLDNQSARQLEDYLALLLLYNANLGSERFAKKIFGQVCDYISKLECVDCDKIYKFLRIILEKKCLDEDMMDIVDEINQIESPNFAIWVLYGYYKIKEEVLERIPQISLHFFIKCHYTIADELMSRYLLNHGYYDCSKEILTVYLMKIHGIQFPDRGTIEDYLRIIDQYEEDDMSIKDREINTYNYLVSLYLYNLVIELTEHKEADGILLKGTMKFMINLMKCLIAADVRLDMGDGSVLALITENNMLARSQEADKLIIEKFLSLSPVIDIGWETYLSGDYYYMLSYMHSFPEVCIPLIKQAEKKGIEIIKLKDMICLVNSLLEHTRDNARGFDRKILNSVRHILQERYSIK